MEKLSGLTDQQQNVFDLITHLATDFRGRFIHGFIQIEAGMEAVIAYTVPKKDRASFVKILETKKFKEKYNKLSAIVKENHFFYENNPSILTDISSVRKIRDILAHKKILTTKPIFDSFNGSDIAFQNYSSESKMKPLIINEHIINEKMQIMGDISYHLQELNLLVRRNLLVR